MGLRACIDEVAKWPPEAFLFDLDGVVWSSNHLHAESFDQVFRTFNLPHRDYKDIAGMSTRDVFEGMSGNNDWSISTINELVLMKQNYFYSHAEKIPDYLVAVCKLRRSYPDTRFGLVSGASWRSASLLLGRTNLDLFDLVISADNKLPSKPSPVPYEFACEALKVTPSCSIAFEDSLNGVLAAVAAGLTVIHIHDELTGSFDCRSFGSRSCVSSLNQVAQQLVSAND